MLSLIERISQLSLASSKERNDIWLARAFEYWAACRELSTKDRGTASGQVGDSRHMIIRSGSGVSNGLLKVMTEKIVGQKAQ